MKRITLFVFALFLTIFSISAQTEQGNILLGGTIGGYSVNAGIGNNKEIQSGFSIIPRIGFFVADNAAIGLGIGYSTDKTKDGTNPAIISNTFEVNPFGRYYVGLGDKFKFFGELGVNVGFGSSKVDVSGFEPFRSRTIGVNLSPGFVFFPSEKIGIELTITGISYSNIDPDTDEDDGTISIFNIGATKNRANGFLNPQLGIYFYF
ncbi:MAG: outer membrane beta-barrel protein [Verrucomicrobia bacterium]|nr:outer membrane beta-barrel protein [Cytophagales bacterium]